MRGDTQQHEEQGGINLSLSSPPTLQSGRAKGLICGRPFVSRAGRDMKGPAAKEASFVFPFGFVIIPEDRGSW